MSGLKELLEVVDAVEKAVDTYVEVMEDGKVDLADVRQLPDLLVAVRTAVDGIKEVPGEVVDATPEEVGQAVVKVVGLIKKVVGLVEK